nr:MAG TPA: hypothetical protein [Caudoviricetes sp.]
MKMVKNLFYLTYTKNSKCLLSTIIFLKILE